MPPGLMPGSPMPGGQPSASPMGGPEAGSNPLGNPESALQILAQLQQTPPQAGEDPLFEQASNAVGLLYNRIAGRSAKAARLVGECMPKLQAAREALATEASRPLAPPPSLGMGMSMGPPPTSPMPGMGM